MRVLHVVPSYLPATRYGGPIFAVHGLCKALAARGHCIEVFTTSVDGPSDSVVPVSVPVPVDGVQVTYFSSKMLRRIYWSPPLERALRGNISSFSVVHLHSVFLWPTWAAARSATTAGVPYLVSPRGMLVKSLIEQRSRFIKSVWIELIEKTNLKRANAIHVTSELEAVELQRFAWRLPPIQMIPNGVDEIVEFDDGELSHDVREIIGERPLVLYLGRLSWKKGLDRLLQAFARTPSGQLVIAGPDDEKLAPQLARLACNLQITHRMRLLARSVLGADKEFLYANARVMVLPSYSENFGNTVLEAMQRGVPVVATPEVGAAEIVRKSGGGIVAAGDPAALATGIGQLIQNEDLARSMGEAGRRFVKENYTWSRIAGRMEVLYASLGSLN
jgi:glycosyltransferase involved in cell wall biosynthesis